MPEPGLPPALTQQHPHLVDVMTEAQEGGATCPRPRGWGAGTQSPREASLPPWVKTEKSQTPAATSGSTGQPQLSLNVPSKPRKAEMGKPSGSSQPLAKKGQLGGGAGVNPRAPEAEISLCWSLPGRMTALLGTGLCKPGRCRPCDILGAGLWERFPGRQQHPRILHVSGLCRQMLENPGANLWLRTELFSPHEHVTPQKPGPRAFYPATHILRVPPNVILCIWFH